MVAEEALLILLLAGSALLLVAMAIVTLFILEVAMRLLKGSRASAAMRSGSSARAEALLREVLDECEYQQLIKRGYVDVRSPSDTERIYRIPGYVGLVRVYEHGMAVRELCVQPLEPLPSADVIAMHKLMIQGDEKEYLATARHYSNTYPNRRYRP